jgi:hypothetical protein
MKYIRTKYGLGEWLTIDKCWHYSSSITIDDNPRKQLKPIKQADIIEELCDELIWIWNKKEYPYSTARQYVRYSFGDLKREMRDQLNYGKNINLDYIIFGAIWTDKGLIYVAKMNGKGELELI